MALTFTVTGGSNRIVSATVPQAPRNLQAAAQGDEVTLTWEAAGMQPEGERQISVSGSGNAIDIQTADV